MSQKLTFRFFRRFIRPLLILIKCFLSNIISHFANVSAPRKISKEEAKQKERRSIIKRTTITRKQPFKTFERSLNSKMAQQKPNVSQNNNSRKKLFSTMVFHRKKRICWPLSSPFICPPIIFRSRQAKKKKINYVLIDLLYLKDLLSIVSLANN